MFTRTVIPEERKSRTIRRLQEEAISTSDFLPCIESSAESRLRTPQEVAVRVICVFLITNIAFGGAEEDDSWAAWLKEFSLWEHASPKEQAFIEGSARSSQEITSATWQIERLVPLLWALKHQPEPSIPRGQTEVQPLYDFLERSAMSDPIRFVKRARLRDIEDILDFSDLVYRLHWATRNASLTGQGSVAGVDGGVVAEWHHSVNWLTCYDDQDWDDVSTDT